MELIDTHAHLYDHKLSVEMVNILQQASSAQVSHICVPNVDLSTLEPMLQLQNNYIHPMLGLHPCHVQPDWPQTLDLLKQALHKHHFCAIGEIGLDYYWDTTYLKEQILALQVQLEWALEHKLPVALHTRSRNPQKGPNAMQDAIQIVKPFAQKGLKGVFHCFSGTLSEAQEIIDMGFYLGVGGTITYKNNPLQQIISEIGLSNVVLETDSPYLAPEPHRGKTNQPAYIKLVAEKIAQLTSQNLQQVAHITTQNAKVLFSLHP